MTTVSSGSFKQKRESDDQVDPLTRYSYRASDDKRRNSAISNLPNQNVGNSTIKSGDDTNKLLTI